MLLAAGGSNKGERRDTAERETCENRERADEAEAASGRVQRLRRAGYDSAVRERRAQRAEEAR